MQPLGREPLQHPLEPGEDGHHEEEQRAAGEEQRHRVLAWHRRRADADRAEDGDADADALRALQLLLQVVVREDGQHLRAREGGA